MTTTCDKCGLPLAFKEIDGKLNPVNPDGSFHFDICREIWMNRIRKEGVPFKEETGHGFHHENKKIYNEIIGKTITGKKYFKLDHDCCPWEHCAVCAPIIEKRKWAA